MNERSEKQPAPEGGRLGEALRFAIAGGVCFLIEQAALILLHDKFGLDTLIATPIAFLISVAVNYVLCVRWAFRGAKEQGGAEKLGFLITSGVGLVWNWVLMLLFRWLLGEEATVLTVLSFTVKMYMVNKALATLLVMIWNYFTKRAILRGGLKLLKKKE